MNYRGIWEKYFDFDRVAERKIHKMLRIHNTTGPFSKINKLRSWLMCNQLRKKYNCKIYPTVKTGKNFHVVHCSWITLGKTTEIGDNCRIYSRVDVIGKVIGDDYTSRKRRHAKIGNDCIIGNGCTIIGAVNIGDDCIIGARAIVTKDVPAHSVVIGTNMIRPKRSEEVEAPYRKELGLE